MPSGEARATSVGAATRRTAWTDLGGERSKAGVPIESGSELIEWRGLSVADLRRRRTDLGGEPAMRGVEATALSIDEGVPIDNGRVGRGAERGGEALKRGVGSDDAEWIELADDASPSEGRAGSATAGVADGGPVGVSTGDGAAASAAQPAGVPRGASAGAGPDAAGSGGASRATAHSSTSGLSGVATSPGVAAAADVASFSGVGAAGVGSARAGERGARGGGGDIERRARLAEGAGILDTAGIIDARRAPWAEPAGPNCCASRRAGRAGTDFRIDARLWADISALWARAAHCAASILVIHDDCGSEGGVGRGVGESDGAGRG